MANERLATAKHATHAAAHSQLEYCSPMSIAFRCDMILNIPFQVDLLHLRQQQQQKIDKRLIAANAKWSYFDYQPGMRVYVLSARKSKLDPI